MPRVAGKEGPIEAPEDVAALYAWADLKGIQYHDFSAARRARARLRERSLETRPEEEELRSRLAAAPDAVLIAGGLAERGTLQRPAGKESMLPQRFPRRRQARDLTPRLSEAAEGGSIPAARPRLEGSAVPLIEASSAAADQATAGGEAADSHPRSSGPAEAGEAAVSSHTGSNAVPAGTSVPAWIYGEGGADFPHGGTVGDPYPAATSPVADTLHHSRERVASRWFALRGVFDPTTPAMEPTQARAREGGSPVLTVFSLAGGVGKTSLTAALGRALSASGESVLLADVTAHGLLPFYFGSKELRPGVVRKFLPPPGSVDAPISLVTYELTAQTEGGGVEQVPAELARSREGFDRLVVDLSPAASWLAGGMLQMDTAMLVPVAPDMNAVIGLRAVERFFAGLNEGAGRPVQPQYLLTQFDASVPLHLDVREVMRQQLGDRLLPFVIRRSPAVSEALAEGMTVIDYAPETGVSDDYRDLANWVRTLAAPAQVNRKSARWSER